MEAENEMVRQRALVGCVFAILTSVNDAKAKEELLVQLMADERIAEEMMELQMQMINCAQAEEVGQKINEDIMPNIVNNQPFKITRNGIEEREEESDILDPGAVDRKMNLMEENVRKMMNMQENGADIFFGGFKQMKRFPFFNKVMNWFVPFYKEHPDLRKEAEMIKGNNFVDKVIRQGPFCESDKYSFFIAFTSVFSRLTEEMKQMIDNGEMGPLGMHEDVKEVQSPAFLRRQYLQDLYRFFRLNSEAKNFGNPYDNANDCPVWVMTAPYFTEKELREVGKYLIRRKKPKTLDKILARCRNLEGTFLCDFLGAEVNRMLGNYDLAASLYKSALTQNPSHMPTMNGYAKTLYALKDYKRAATYFDALRTQKPDRRSYAMNYIMSMTMSGQAESIMNDIYKLEFENPDDIIVKNLLGWVLLYAGKKEKALEIFEALLRDKKSSQDDLSVLFNTLYAYMANGKMQEAADVLASCAKKMEKKQLWSSMQDDLPMLKQYNIREAELEIIISSVGNNEQ
jgi:tetratricopeptide (TPR) repeat protein